MKSKNIELDFMGQKLVLKSESDPALVQEVVSLVQFRLKEAERRGKKSAIPHLIAILALLDLAEDYVESKRKVIQHKKAVAENTSQLQKLIEADLQQMA